MKNTSCALELGVDVISEKAVTTEAAQCQRIMDAEKNSGCNCRTCSFQKKCDFYWDMTGDKRLMSLYAACEDVDGYYRDGCVWDNDIDSYDTSSVHVEYESGTELTYSMNAFLPYEGQYMFFIGDKGRLDVRKYSRQPWEAPAATEIRLSINRGESKLIELPPRNGGAHEKLKDMFFRPGQKDELEQLAGSRAGIMSSLIGIAARHSIETGEKIAIPNLIDLPPRWKCNSPTLKS